MELQEEKPDDEDLKSDNARMGTQVLSEGIESGGADW